MANYHRSAVAQPANLPSYNGPAIERERYSAEKPGQIMAPSRSPREPRRRKKAIKKEIFLIYYFKNTSRAYKIPPVKFISFRVPLIPPIIFFLCILLAHLKRGVFLSALCEKHGREKFYVVSEFLWHSRCFCCLFCHFYS